MRIFLIEFYKVFTRRRSYIGFVAVFVVVVLLLLAVKSEGEDVISFITQNLQDAFTFQGNLVNGNLFAHIVLRSLWVHIPILIIMVTGDLVSGEYETGTFRMVLSRPVSRFSIITSKFAAGAVYTIMLILFLAVFSIGLGWLFLGSGDLLVTKGTINIFPESDTFWRFVSAYSFGILSMLTIASLSMFLSTIFDNSVTTILTSIAIVIVLTFLSTFNIPIISYLKPFLFTTYTGGWEAFFDFKVDFSKVLFQAIVLLIHIISFYILSLYIFLRKDILS